MVFAWRDVVSKAVEFKAVVSFSEVISGQL